jgi:hypothetical protein
MGKLELKGRQLSFRRTWTVDDRIGGGGSGEVYRTTSDSYQAAAKFVPKDPGADRELLLVDLPGLRNVVPPAPTTNPRRRPNTSCIVPVQDARVSGWMREPPNADSG